MTYSSQLSATKTMGTLCLGGFLLICSSFTASAESPEALPHESERVWAPSPAADVVAAELRGQVAHGLRDEMVAALEPTSVVWKGALDGRLLAQEMREEVSSQMQGEMIAGLQQAFGSAENRPEAAAAPQEPAAIRNGWLALARPDSPSDTP